MRRVLKGGYALDRKKEFSSEESLGRMDCRLRLQGVVIWGRRIRASWMLWIKRTCLIYSDSVKRRI